MMTTWQAFVGEQLLGGATPAQETGLTLVDCFGDSQAEYAALGAGPAIVDRNDRAMLEITGADRASWLHNLTTNEVKNLSPGEGNYAFAVNVQGRILFDLNVIVRRDSIWLDLDRKFLETATKHFDKYLITEDVTVTNRSDAFVRFGLVGEQIKAVLSELGAAHAATMPWYDVAETTWRGVPLALLRHDFCGLMSVELLVPPDRAVEVWKSLTDPSGPCPATPVGRDAVEVRRIEAGIPWPSSEINQEYLPAETGQFDRAVSFRKGCYLGQEIVERMRSRSVVARKLVGLRFEGDEVPVVGDRLCDAEGGVVGVMTSVCHSIALRAPIGLGYVKTAASSVGTSLTAKGDRCTAVATVAELPFTAGDTGSPKADP